MSEGPDSFTGGLVQAAQSRKGKSIAAVLWPWVLAAVTCVAGYVGRSWQLEPRVVLLEAAEAKKRETLDRIDRNVLELRSREQQHLLQIGRQAAYATACCEGTEARKIRDAKRAIAKDAAGSYERLVNKGTDPEDAYSVLLGQP